jgi:hypothetical protein
MNILAMLVPVIMSSRIYLSPLWQESYYCTTCVLRCCARVGQRCVPFQLKRQHHVKRLDTFRQVLWAALMLCLWTGVWFDWVDAEPFSAFIFESASWAAIAIAVTFALLSTVIMRPYCRFVCPMGTVQDCAEGQVRSPSIGQSDPLSISSHSSQKEKDMNSKIIIVVLALALVIVSAKLAMGSSFFFRPTSRPCATAW